MQVGQGRFLWSVWQLQHQQFIQPREDHTWYWAALMAHGPLQPAFHVKGNEGVPARFLLCVLATPRCCDLDLPHSYFQHYSHALLPCNMVRDDCLKCCLLYFQIFMYFKMNAYLWFILSCTHLGESQQPEMSANSSLPFLVIPFSLPLLKSFWLSSVSLSLPLRVSACREGPTGSLSSLMTHL